MTQVLVKLKDGHTLDEVLAAHGGGKLKHYHADIEVHEVEPNGKAQNLVASLNGDTAAVEFAELDQPCTPSSIANDPYYGQEWHLAKINAPTAWDTTTGNPAVIVAIIDSGVTPVPDLAGNMVPGFSVFDSSANTADVSGHGTTVAGVVAAIGDNAYEIVGVSYTTHIMPIRICDSNQSLSWTFIAQAITYAANNGCKVANCSWESVPPLWTSSTINAAVAYLRTHGGVMVAPSGNAASNLGSGTLPAGWIVAGGTDQNDALATFSNYGSCVSVGAPAVAILTTGRAGDIRNCSGTSYASPIVAATAALMFAAHPAITPDQLITAIKASADDLGIPGADVYFGSGRVDVAAAVAAAVVLAGSPPAVDTTPPVASISTPGDGDTVSGVVSVHASATDDVAVASLAVYIDGALKSQATGAALTFNWQTKKIPKGNHTITAIAKDTSGNQGTTSIRVTK